ncbi:MAG: response regulator transcription factor [Alicyclobacillus sp.]|nr:response regulator transcription factor [Alicyclobacillus sp.]
MIRVLIVDDHEVVRMGLRAYLDTEADIEVVGEAANGETAVRLAQTLQPDVILMDLLMPDISGIEATNRLKRAGVAAKIIMLTSSVDDEQMILAIRAGALSYLLKTSPAADVVDAIRQAAAGRSVLDPQVQQRLVGGLQADAGTKPWEELTDRERDVLKGIASGKNNQEIADHLGIGVKTVKTHVSNILLKLGVMDRTQAAIYAIRHHLD